MECPAELSATAIYYDSLRIMEDFAGQLGNTEDATACAQLAAETKTAFDCKFYHEQSGGWGSQTADAVALRFEIYPDGKGGLLAKSLAREVLEQHNDHSFVGIHGGRPLYTQLCEWGYEDIAISAMKQPTWPSLASCGGIFLKQSARERCHGFSDRDQSWA